MEIKKLLLVLYLINLLNINLIKSFEFVTIQFEKSDCSGKALIIHSSTQCSTAGYYSIDKDGKSAQFTVPNNIKKFEDCTNAQSNDVIKLDQCFSGGFKSYYNENSNVSLPDGYCAEVKLLPGGDCSNGLELISYYNGVCNSGEEGTQYRYECNGNKVKRYKCKDCMKQLVGCVFDKDLDSIDSKCSSSIKSKSLNDITGDKSIQTPAPTTKPNDNSSSNNSSASTGGGNNNSNTGSATTGGDKNNNHSTILNINILFILLLSILLLLN